MLKQISQIQDGQKGKMYITETTYQNVKNQNYPSHLYLNITLKSQHSSTCLLVITYIQRFIKCSYIHENEDYNLSFSTSVHLNFSFNKMHTVATHQ